MKKILISIALATSFATVFTGCAVKSGNTKLEHVTKTELSKMLIKGETTEDGVRQLFGEPQSVDFLPDGRKKWVYTFAAVREKGINYIPVVNWFARGTNNELRTLVIIFKDGKVQDYMFSISKGETKAGAFN